MYLFVFSVIVFCFQSYNLIFACVTRDTWKVTLYFYCMYIFVNCCFMVYGDFLDEWKLFFSVLQKLYYLWRMISSWLLCTFCLTTPLKLLLSKFYFPWFSSYIFIGINILWYRCWYTLYSVFKFFGPYILFTLKYTKYNNNQENS